MLFQEWIHYINFCNYDLGYKIIDQKHYYGVKKEFKEWCNQELIKMAKKGYISVYTFDRSLQCNDLDLGKELWKLSIQYLDKKLLENINPIYTFEIIKWAHENGINFKPESLYSIIHTYGGKDVGERLTYLLNFYPEFFNLEN